MKKIEYVEILIILFLFESESMSATKNEISQAKKWINNSNIISPNISTTISIKTSINHHYIKASAMIIPKTHIALITNATAINPVALPFFNSLNSF